MNEKKIKVAFNAHLHEKDTESQTYGCRQNNPDICKFNGLSDVCAFTNPDGLYHKPSRAWKKQFLLLKQGGD